MSYRTKFGGYLADADLSASDWTKRWNTAATAEVLGIGFERIGEDVSSADATEYTFSGIITEVGTYIVAVVGYSSGVPGVQGVAVDGQVGNELRDDFVDSNLSSSWWLLNPSSFANGDINVTFNSAGTRASIAVWRLYGHPTGIYDASASGSFGDTDVLLTEIRNAVLAQATKVGDATGTDIFWSGVTEWVDEVLDGTVYRSAADKLLITDDSSVGLVADGNGTPSASLWTALAYHTPVTYFPSGQGADFSKESSNALVFWSWDVATLLTDLEVLALIRPTAQSDTFDCGVLLRGSGASEAAGSGYAFVLSQTSAGLRDIVRLLRVGSGSVTELDAEPFAWSLNTNYWLKLRVRGSTLQARVWADGTVEPSTWNIEDSDSTITTAGRVGIFHRFTGSSFEVGQFEAKELYAEWPENDIPNNWTVDIQGGPQSNKVSFKPDIGPPIDRRRGSAVSRTYQVECPGLTHEEYLAFVEFYHTTLKEGTLPFMIMDPFSGEEKTFKFSSDDPAYMESIQRSPGADYSEGIYKLTFSVTRLD